MRKKLLVAMAMITVIGLTACQKEAGNEAPVATPTTEAVNAPEESSDNDVDENASNITSTSENTNTPTVEPTVTVAPEIVYTDAEYFTYDNWGDRIVIRGYTGDASVVAIPKEIDGIPVQIIDEKAFYQCDFIEEIILPENVTNIQEEAFSECKNLKKVVLPDTLEVIDNFAFYECSSLSEITIPNNVEEINKGAFYGCTSLSEIIIPKEASVDEYAFLECTSLTSIKVAEDNWFCTSKDDNGNECNAIIRLADNALILGCATTVIPDGVKILNSGAFYECSGLTEINIPDSVEYIEDNVFCGCVNLKEVVVPNNVCSLGKYAFEACTSLETVILPESLSLEDGTFKGCSSLKNIVLPKSMSSIGESVFEDCTSLESIKLPDAMYEIGTSVFKNCISLKEVNIPTQDIGIIENYTFWGCTSLEELVIPDNIGFIGVDIFENCDNLTIYISKQKQDIANELIDAGYNVVVVEPTPTQEPTATPIPTPEYNVMEGTYWRGSDYDGNEKLLLFKDNIMYINGEAFAEYIMIYADDPEYGGLTISVNVYDSFNNGYSGKAYGDYTTNSMRMRLSVFSEGVEFNMLSCSQCSESEYNEAMNAQ